MPSSAACVVGNCGRRLNIKGSRQFLFKRVAVPSWALRQCASAGTKTSTYRLLPAPGNNAFERREPAASKLSMTASPRATCERKFATWFDVEQRRKASKIIEEFSETAWLPVWRHRPSRCRANDVTRRYLRGARLPNTGIGLISNRAVAVPREPFSYQLEQVWRAAFQSVTQRHAPASPRPTARNIKPDNVDRRIGNGGCPRSRLQDCGWSPESQRS
jgi:hypothetical protein